MSTRSTPELTFRLKAPGIALKLMGDFPIGRLDACAILGNLGHECDGFTTLQETAPTVKGSRGGYGWPQWTGPRRRAYEAYCKRNGLDPASDKANYAYLFLELKGSERGAIDAVRAAGTLGGKVETFERTFLRAGIKHYESRKRWAAIADEVVPANAAPAPMPMPERIAVLRAGADAISRRKEKLTVTVASTGTGTAGLGSVTAAAALRPGGADVGLLLGLGGATAVCAILVVAALLVGWKLQATGAALVAAEER